MKRIIFIVVMLVAFGLQAQDVKFVNSKRASDMVIYMADFRWESDKVVHLVDHKWQMGGENVWRIVKRRGKDVIKVYVTVRKYEADYIVFMSKHKWGLRSSCSKMNCSCR